jgi:hypothetical protein
MPLDHDTIALMKLKEEMRLRQQRHGAGPRPANEAMTPRIKMIVRDGTFHPGARLNVDGLAPQAHDHVDASDFIAFGWYWNFADRNIGRRDIH